MTLLVFYSPSLVVFRRHNFSFTSVPKDLLRDPAAARGKDLELRFDDVHDARMAEDRPLRESLGMDDRLVGAGVGVGAAWWLRTIGTT